MIGRRRGVRGEGVNDSFESSNADSLILLDSKELRLVIDVNDGSDYCRVNFLRFAGVERTLKTA